METGSKSLKSNYFQRDLSLDVNRIKQTHAIFNLYVDGLRILITEDSKQSLLALGHYTWSKTLSDSSKIKALEKIFLEAEFNFDDCLSCTWYTSEKEMCLVPLELFQDGKESQILGFSARPNSLKVYKNEVWAKQHIVCCYSISDEIDKWLNFNFPHSEKHHNSRALVNIYDHFPQYGIYAHLHIEQDFAEFIICNDGRVLMCNQYPYKAIEDLLYYVLFAFEQSRLLAPEIDLLLSGPKASNTKLRDVFEEYVGAAKEIPLPKSLKISPQIKHQALRDNYVLLGGL